MRVNRSMGGFGAVRFCSHQSQYPHAGCDLRIWRLVDMVRRNLKLSVRRGGTDSKMNLSAAWRAVRECLVRHVWLASPTVTSARSSSRRSTARTPSRLAAPLQRPDPGPGTAVGPQQNFSVLSSPNAINSLTSALTTQPAGLAPTNVE
jgi:hypothetical protein